MELHVFKWNTNIHVHACAERACPIQRERERKLRSINNYLEDLINHTRSAPVKTWSIWL